MSSSGNSQPGLAFRFRPIQEISIGATYFHPGHIFEQKPLSMPIEFLAMLPVRRLPCQEKDLGAKAKNKSNMEWWWIGQACVCVDK